MSVSMGFPSVGYYAKFALSWTDSLTGCSVLNSHLPLKTLKNTEITVVEITDQ